MALEKQLLPEALTAILEGDPSLVSAALAEVHPEDLAAVIGELPSAQGARVMQSLPVEQAAEVLERLPEEQRIALLEQWRPESSAAVITEMSDDDRADLVTELPSELRESILSEMQRQEPEVAAATRALALYGEDTAGGIMTTEYIALGPGMTCDKAITEVRRAAREQNPELIYSLYVVDAGKLVGVISLRDLILGDADDAPVERHDGERGARVIRTPIRKKSHARLQSTTCPPCRSSTTTAS